MRETSLSLLLVLGLAVAGARTLPWRSAAWLALGFLAVWLPEQIVLHIASGELFYRLRTDLHHIDVPSDNLRGEVAPAGTSAPLNVAVMRRWEGIGPVRLNYLVDPWLNLFLNTRYGLDFLLAGVGTALAWRHLYARARRAVTTLAVAAGVHVATVVYIVATDPKARMMMPSIVAACVIAGIVLPPLWRGHGRAVLKAAGGLKVAVLLVTIDITSVFNLQYPELAARVVATAPGAVFAGPWTLNQLALADPALRARLSAGAPPPGGLWLTTARRGDPHGDAPPDPSLRWHRVGEATGDREPVVASLGRALGLPVERLVARNRPVATLWQRLPDALLPTPSATR